MDNQFRKGQIVILDKGFANSSRVKIKDNFDSVYVLIESQPNISHFVLKYRLTPLDFFDAIKETNKEELNPYSPIAKWIIPR
jgi:hypothetical protein